MKQLMLFFRYLAVIPLAALLMFLLSYVIRIELFFFLNWDIVKGLLFGLALGVFAVTVGVAAYLLRYIVLLAGSSSIGIYIIGTVLVIVSLYDFIVIGLFNGMFSTFNILYAILLSIACVSMITISKELLNES